MHNSILNKNIFLSFFDMAKIYMIFYTCKKNDIFLVKITPKKARNSRMMLLF